MQYTPMKVVLGSSSIRAFVAAPKHLKVVGVVRMGQEFGLLALNEDGEYLRVNGSQNVLLNTREVQRALQAARLAGHHEDDPALVGLPAPVVNKPTVAIRKRRHALLPCARQEPAWQAS